jgi:hypothetical protein
MRFHKGRDGWGRDSYQIPQYAVVGSSCTGDWSDSPAPTGKVKAELEDFRKVLRANHIRSRCGATRSGNVFMVKLWVTVKREDYVAAEKLAAEYLKAHDKDTRYIHDAY